MNHDAARLVCFVAVVLFIVAGLVAALDITGVADMLAARRADAEAGRALALAELERARADAALHDAAAAAVRADTAIATAAALWPVWSALALLSFAAVAGLVVWVARRPDRRPVEGGA